VPSASRRTCSLFLKKNLPLDPDQYTIIPVPLKIIKVLIQELSFSSGEGRLDAAAAAADLAEEGSDDGEWEDIPSALDLGSAVTKQGQFNPIPLS
jgi:hypothetical protein